ncbi:Haloacid dehalogenase-like hydrolase domain-containing protein 2 [Liparis tanakae]|uniref:Haloacid dehalogenase-like hydrolase domain-containing protein 2 n=1 Tax=Liparis tanakae TaxID=230148 RepID=A0A4Z2J9L1_9TELE|nr:Haloacid dehalogenase-like hydrolase domain-containing protein 2 [Liparis tanakae]
MSGRRALKAVLIDLSGTLHVEDTAVPGAQDALHRLRQAAVAVKFVTNTTKESKRNLLERLHRLNFDLQEKEIFTSLSIETSEPNAVVVGLAPDHFNYQTLNTAFRMILDGAPLIAIHKARYYKRKDGLALGPGPFVAGLEYAADCQATVDARDDVGGAQNAGMLGILVRTGKYREGDERKINPPPHFTCDSFPEAVDYILKNLL